jgi:hypothetical protein
LQKEELLLPARRVFEWYNGALNSNLDTETEFNLAQIKDIMIIGNGNIFSDISRVLLQDPRNFMPTDMHDSVID